ncbi:hypothetical protein, partial [Roseiconus nitratireducens]|uniref:hypothetical protein n=1 Tax=Roseiconus nitratireducens TaxID=2605748 RepID=UPI001F30B426
CGDGPCPDEEEPCEEKFDPKTCCEKENDLGGGDSGGGDGGGCSGGSCSSPASTSEKPIRYFNGELRLSASDLPASTSSLGHRRAYSNQMSRSHDYGNGFN